jgi:hypothetical protein
LAYDGFAHLIKQGQTGFIVGGTRKRYTRLRAALPPPLARSLA